MSMRRIGPIVVAIAGWMSAASAADHAMPVKAQRTVAVYDWTGFYAGVNLGYLTGHNPSNYSLDSAPVGASMTLAPRGAIGGVQAGYNKQIAHWVFGVEADWQGADADDFYCTNCGVDPGGGMTQRVSWIATVRGRAGLGTGPLLFYGTAGAAFGRVSVDVNCCVGGQVLVSNLAATRTGWTAGTGIEAALGGNWTVKAEYLYLHLGTAFQVVPFAPPFAPDAVRAGGEFNAHLARLGVNYRFGQETAGASWSQTRDWAGAYAGVNLGFGAARTPLTQELVATPAATLRSVVAPDGAVGGGQVGFNWQAGRVVAGLEADVQWSAQKDSICRGCPPTPGFGTSIVEHRLPWLVTARARIGYGAGPALLYVTGGGAFGRVEQNLSQFAPPLSSFSAARFERGGWVVGGGIEAAIAENWSAKLEYLHINLGTFRSQGNIGIVASTYESDISNNLYRVGLNYRFGASPLVAAKN
ncbi:outer membrane protein [Bradyrhizobium sp. DOA9]|uniref:outer membrane protein n=1 Tax=Bradyrhizobium sp. DOA9 TaxID=1126627 RepID=UPI000469DE7B|nr:outer membrane beta-barrel protein [Bradyrhizobium sp. DOA9]